MAEGFANALLSDNFVAYSAGMKKSSLNPYAEQVMAEIGIDITHHFSKTVSELEVTEFDFVITVCDNAKENCPYSPAKVKLIHHSFDDPPHLTEEMSSELEILPVYRRVRDEIKIFIENLVYTLEND